ncbi:MAG: Lrp/AsnC family transcriptional regulator [Thermoplasmatota archaeon]
MDAKDLELLTHINSQGRLDPATLSVQLGISPPNVERRLKLLKREGILLGFSAFFDRRMFGYDTTYLKLHFDIGEIDYVVDEVSSMPQVASVYPNMDDFMLVEVVHWDQESLVSAIRALERIVAPYTVSDHFMPMLPEEVPETPQGKKRKLLAFLVKDGQVEVPVLADLLGEDEDSIGEMIASLLTAAGVKVKPLIQEDLVQPFPTFSVILEMSEGCTLDSCYSDIRKASKESWDTMPLSRPQGLWMKCFGRDLHAMDLMLERYRRMEVVGEVMVVLPDTMRINRSVDLNIIRGKDL